MTSQMEARRRELDEKENELRAGAVRLEKQLAKALRPIGKRYLPTKERPFTSVESAAGSCVRVSVSIERHGGVHNLPKGTFAVRVHEVRRTDGRVKCRTKEFSGLGSELTTAQLEQVQACVKKHLTVADQMLLSAVEES